MSGTPTLFLKDRVLCRCRNSEEAKQKRMEKGSCDDLTLRTPSAVSLPVPHQPDLALLSWLLLRGAILSSLTLSGVFPSGRPILPTPGLPHLAASCLPLPSQSPAPHTPALAQRRRQGLMPPEGLVAELTVCKGGEVSGG